MQDKFVWHPPFFTIFFLQSQHTEVFIPTMYNKQIFPYNLIRIWKSRKEKTLFKVLLFCDKINLSEIWPMYVKHIKMVKVAYFCLVIPIHRNASTNKINLLSLLLLLFCGCKCLCIRCKLKIQHLLLFKYKVSCHNM